MTEITVLELSSAPEMTREWFLSEAVNRAFYFWAGSDLTKFTIPDLDPQTQQVIELLLSAAVAKK